jgi:hypothetical protein
VSARRIAVVSTGYVGLMAGACRAFLGYRVVCTDVDESGVAIQRAGKIGTQEAGSMQGWASPSLLDSHPRASIRKATAILELFSDRPSLPRINQFTIGLSEQPFRCLITTGQA